MRSETEIKQLILERASTDQRIRAVLLNGSRANDKIEPDPHQDFDLVFLVTAVEEFVSDHHWTDFLGEKLLWQLPDAMTLGYEEETDSFTYLMQFQDGNRIDLTLFPVNKLRDSFQYDSLTRVWLDKDDLFGELPEASDRDYLIKRPSEKEFRDICNEFWWVCPYVAKALVRKEIIHAKELMEIPVRRMFLRMIEIHVGTQTDFSVSAGKGGKFIKDYLSGSAYENILLTYPDHEPGNIIRSMNLMMEEFGEYARGVAQELRYPYHLKEERNSINYFQELVSYGE